MYDKSRRRDEKKVFREDYALILDYMPQGNPMDRHHPSHKTRPIAQAIGDRYFTLLEFYPKPGVSLAQGERVYVGIRFKELREKVDYVWGEPLIYDDLSGVVLDKEEVFVTFFNISSPLTIKLHSLELLPGIGKKTMWTLLEERRKRPFESFQDIKNRGKISDPVAIIVERILSELQGKERYYLFIDPPPNVSNAVVLGYLPRIYHFLREKRGREY